MDVTSLGLSGPLVASSFLRATGTDVAFATPEPTKLGLKCTTELIRKSLAQSQMKTSSRSVRNPATNTLKKRGGAAITDGERPMEQIKFKLTSAAPLLMHNAQLCDPLNKWSREIKRISGKRKKTDADQAEIARLEYLGSLYMAQDGQTLRPCIPSTLIEASILGAARTQKRGKQVQAGLVVPNDAVLEYDGPVAPDELAASSKFVLRAPAKVGQARVMRTRPKFSKWSADVIVEFYPADLDRDTVIDLVVLAGEITGIGDWRPKFGRFSAISVS